jgi:DNA-directed RNA polymerase subunit F
LPFIDGDIVSELKRQAKVEDIVDFMNMDDDLRQKILDISPT